VLSLVVEVSVWDILRVSRNGDRDLALSLSELQESVSRSFILITMSAGLAWQAVLALGKPGELVPRLAPTIWILALTSSLALRLLPRRLLLAQLLWLLGLGITDVAAICTFHEPLLTLVLPLLPLMAGILIGRASAMLMEGLTVGVVWWLRAHPAIAHLSATYSLAIIVEGALTAVLGCAAARGFLAVTQWSLSNYVRTRILLEEARDQRVELKQVQEDLVQANRELARLTDRLKAMYRVAEEARRTKEEFVANVSHELRTPLNMIIGFSEMIVQSPHVYGDALPPALLADIGVIRRNSQHLAKLIDDVLDLSQVEAGRMALTREPACIREIIDEAAEAVRPLYQSKGLYLETDASKDVPTVLCDRTRVRQVLTNLLANAGRFTQHGGVRVAAWREGDKVLVSVADTGPGIAPEDQKRLFEPFQQLDNSIRREHGGSGLGLSISKRFVEMHGGQMWLHSELGVGTTITFSLPIEPPSGNDYPQGGDVRRWFGPYSRYEPRNRPSKAPRPVSVPRYVVLEDGETLARLLSRYLHEHDIVSVETVEEAIFQMSRSPARALIVNQPPGMSFPVGRLRELPYGTPAVSCWVAGQEEAARRLAVARYLVKPVVRETLLSALEELGKEVKTVLLVDDEPEVLQLFTRMLSSPECGYNVLQARNGEWALTLLRERRPDVMLLDLVMPGVDGFEVLRQKSCDPAVRDIPVIVMSAKDPSREPIATDALTVTRSGGISVRELVASIEALSEILAPPA
jgi:signal transduction histidine kinase/CheY-like chemotaxis protein